ncbi:Sirtuin family [Trinorchestia longiramus]|nr:Sirtuin family [Trinorchestia longiramus]
MASESNMAEGLRVMDSTVPAKRLRLDYPGEMLASEQKENFQYFIRTPDMLTSGGRVSSTSSNSSVAMEGGSLTCDSGFNELTPPRLLEEEQQPQLTSTSSSLSSHSPQPHGIKRSHASCVDEDDEETASLTHRSPVTSMSLGPQRNSFTTSVTQPSTMSHCSNSPSPSHHFHKHHSSIDGGNPNDANDGDDNSVSSDDSRVSRLSHGDEAGGEGSDCGEESTPEPAHWVQQQMRRGHNPRAVLSRVLGADPSDIPDHVSDEMIWRLLLNVLTDGPRRERLRHLNTMEDAVRLMRSSRRIIVLTGAGVSVSCGIPDFRSRDGIYARLAVDFPNLPDPQAMFDINFFRRDPRPFFKFAREIYPGQFTPSLCHRFLRCMESHNKLLRNYTQNIDTLEQVAGISNVIQCHGSFASATCQRCGFKVSAGAIKEDIFQQRIPMCPHCTPPSTPLPCYGARDSIYSNSGDTPTPPMQSSASPYTSPARDAAASPQPGAAGQESSQQSTAPSHNLDPANSPTQNDDDSSLETFNFASLCARNESISSMMQTQPIMKPDIVFFGEGLPDEFHDSISEDQNQCDLLIVIGSSLKVRPVAHIPNSIPPHVPQILINREPLDHLTFDIELLGDCDVIVNELCHRLGPSWTNVCNNPVRLTEIRDLPPKPETPSSSPATARPAAGGGDSDTSAAGGAVTVADAPHPKDEDDIEALRACWAPKIRESVAARLPENCYLYNGGHRYVYKGAEVFYDPDDVEGDDDDSQNQDDDDDDDDEEGELVVNDDDSSSPAREASSHTKLGSGDASSEVALEKEYLPSFSLQNTEETAVGVSPPHSLDDIVEAVQAVEQADQLLYNSCGTIIRTDCSQRTLSCDSSASSSSCQLSTAATVTVDAPSVQEMDSLLSGSEQEEDCVESDWMTLHASLADTPSFGPEVGAPTLRSSEDCSRAESQTQFSEPSESASKLSEKIDCISRTSVAL